MISDKLKELGFRKRWIVAEVKKGRFKGKRIDVEIGQSSSTSMVRMNGKDISDRVLSLHLYIRPEDDLIELVLEMIE